MEKNRFFGRKNEIELIERFIKKPGFGFTYLRGRRRIGKSTLLKKLNQSKEDCFYFYGANDENTLNAQKRFAKSWDEFSQKSILSIIQPSKLNWELIFNAIRDFSKHNNRDVVLLFDEIQWLAKQGNGFIGILKNALDDWKQIDSIKLIIAGSSNKFYEKFTGSDESILRGLKTHAAIWL
ncbi:MAG: ATP-binding protein, partial [Proteobacteria bacterium]|nr:ATP-binding protein [Pseudomonadota bacterium]